MKLILIRGNSGSGKTSLANLLHKGIPHSRLIHQDVIRRDILNTHDDLVVQELIIAMLEVMKKQEQPIILEGIFRKDKYQKLFDYLFNHFDCDCYYYNLSFEETLKRHQTRNEKEEFDDKTMKSWFREQDQLNIAQEILFDQNVSLKQAIDKVIKNLKQ